MGKVLSGQVIDDHIEVSILERRARGDLGVGLLSAMGFQMGDCFGDHGLGFRLGPLRSGQCDGWQ